MEPVFLGQTDPLRWATQSYTRPRNCVEKVMRVFLACVTGAASMLSTLGFITTGNPIALASAVIFGVWSFYLLTTNNQHVHVTRRVYHVSDGCLSCSYASHPTHWSYVNPRPERYRAVRTPSYIDTSSYSSPRHYSSGYSSYSSSSSRPAEVISTEEAQRRADIGRRTSSPVRSQSPSFVPPAVFSLSPDSGLATAISASQAQMRAPVGERMPSPSAATYRTTEASTVISTSQAQMRAPVGSRTSPTPAQVATSYATSPTTQTATVITTEEAQKRAPIGVRRNNVAH